MEDPSTKSPPAAADCYRSVGNHVFPVGSHGEVVYSTPSGVVRVLSSPDVGVLTACRTFRTLEEHARTICQEFGLPPDQTRVVSEQLSRFAGEGLLVSRRDVLGAGARR